MAADGSPRNLACPGCGAAIPPDARPGRAVTCSYCGATYQAPEQSQAGGVAFTAASVTILGDVVGRDKVVHGEASPTATAQPPREPTGTAQGAEDHRPAPQKRALLKRVKHSLRRSLGLGPIPEWLETSPSIHRRRPPQ
jgi:hypothetical protein